MGDSKRNVIYSCILVYSCLCIMPIKIVSCVVKTLKGLYKEPKSIYSLVCVSNTSFMIANESSRLDLINHINEVPLKCTLLCFSISVMFLTIFIPAINPKVGRSDKTKATEPRQIKKGSHWRGLSKVGVDSSR